MKTIEAIAKHWQYLSPYITHPRNNEMLSMQSAFLDELLEIVGENEEHPLMSLVDVVSANIEAYENEKFADTLGNGIDALRFLMREYGLSQADLPEIGSQGVVSEVLRGKRRLNRRQIERLSKRFSVSVATFFD